MDFRAKKKRRDGDGLGTTVRDRLVSIVLVTTAGRPTLPSVALQLQYHQPAFGVGYQLVGSTATREDQSAFTRFSGGAPLDQLRLNACPLLLQTNGVDRMHMILLRFLYSQGNQCLSICSQSVSLLLLQ